MKNIISILLMLTLVSGCEKVNALKAIEPVDSQVVKSDPAKQIFHLTSSTVVYILCGVIVLLFVGCMYRYCYPASADLPLVEVNPKAGLNSSSESILPKGFMASDIKLFTSEERSFLAKYKNDGHGKGKIFDFLVYMYEGRQRRGAAVQPLRNSCSHEQKCKVYVDEFNKEMDERRKALVQ